MELTSDTSTMKLSVIVPARNEELSLADCLRSLVAQSEDGFALGSEWEILCVDDGSMDATRAIARSFSGVTVLVAPVPPDGWTGKNAAVWLGAEQARGELLLFTDADTVHEQGSLQRAGAELECSGVGMLSYSPRQLVRGFWQHALMPLVFSELACLYPPSAVSDPQSAVAAANGQFVMMTREAYCMVGGHKAVAGDVLEDVALARKMKRARLGVRFRYAPDAISTWMYRSNGAMFEGWTKNLARLFPQPIWLAAMRKLDLLLMLGLPVLMWLLPRVELMMWWQRALLAAVWVHVLWRYFRRVRRSNFAWGDCVLSVAGIPLFALLLTRSWIHHTLRKQVRWKGREYSLRGTRP